MEDFMEKFDPIQIRYGGTDFRHLIEIVARTAQAAAKPLIAIFPISTAIRRLDPSGSCFTSSHLIFARLCLEAREYYAAVPVLDKDIYHFPLSSDKGGVQINPRFWCSHHEQYSTFITNASGLSEKLDYRDHLQYFLFGAMIYIGLKNWERASLFLEAVIISPAPNTTSMIQVEAYKKWVLVSLLLKGRPLSIPKTTSPHAAKTYASLAKAYDAIARIFREGIVGEHSVHRLMAETEAGRVIWREDCNTGLVKQVIDAFRRFSIARLEKTYVAMRIIDLAHRTSPDPNDYAETAAYVSSLISSRYLNATLSVSPEEPQAWILRFATSSTAGPQGRTEQQQYEDLVQQTARTMKLSDHVREADRRLGLSKEYLDWVRRVQKNKDGGGNAEVGGFPITSDDYIGDEDMMSDL
ncbi:hypothetical protein MMC07_007406 [Pseudocyphellaria aurata]|nr:hypothetical protein [Pseudocyphellaria aurata]